LREREREMNGWWNGWAYHWVGGDWVYGKQIGRYAIQLR